jgi:hypothetical protein
MRKLKAELSAAFILAAPRSFAQRPTVANSLQILFYVVDSYQLHSKITS